MLVIVNGEQREINAASVDALLSELDYEGTHFAIALNYDVVPKSRWALTCVMAGEFIYIFTPGLGGCGGVFSKLSAFIARLDRAIQYAAASRFLPHGCGVLDPRLRGDDSST